MNQIEHSELQKTEKKFNDDVKKLSDDVLRYIIKDCQEALKNMLDLTKAGYYLAIVSCCSMELNRRKNKK